MDITNTSISKINHNELIKWQKKNIDYVQNLNP